MEKIADYSVCKESTIAEKFISYIPSKIRALALVAHPVQYGTDMKSLNTIKIPITISWIGNCLGKFIGCLGKDLNRFFIL